MPFHFVCRKRNGLKAVLIGEKCDPAPHHHRDPQEVVDEPPTWWWNPLSYVTDDTTAAKLAGHFTAGSLEPGDKDDAFFHPAGKDLLAGMLLPAALDGRRSPPCSRG